MTSVLSKLAVLRDSRGVILPADPLFLRSVTSPRHFAGGLLSDMTLLSVIAGISCHSWGWYKETTS